MTAFLKRAYMAQVNKLKAAQAPPAAPAGSKPAKRAPIRPLGNGGDSIARFPKKGKNFKGEGNPTYWAELYDFLPDAVVLCPVLLLACSYNGTKDASGKFIPQGQIEMELACLTQVSSFPSARYQAFHPTRLRRTTRIFAPSAAEEMIPIVTQKCPGQFAMHLTKPLHAAWL